MLYKILTTLILLIHAAVFFFFIGGMGFGVGVGEMSAQKVAPLSVGLMGLSGLSLILAIAVYFFPGWSATGSIFIMGGVGALALWQFAVTGFGTPINLATFILEIALAGIPFMVLRQAAT